MFRTVFRLDRGKSRSEEKVIIIRSLEQSSMQENGGMSSRTTDANEHDGQSLVFCNNGVVHSQSTHAHGDALHARASRESESHHNNGNDNSEIDVQANTEEDKEKRTDHCPLPYRVGGLVVIVSCGLGLGLGLHPDVSSMKKNSNVIGWTYFAAWSISFYPQVCVLERGRGSF